MASRRAKSPGRDKKEPPVQAEEAPVQAQTASMLWGMPWMRVLIALLLSMALQVAVNVYIDTSTQDTEKQLGALFAAGTPESIEMLAIADTIRKNLDFYFKAGLVINGVCFGPLIAVLFLESAFWGFISHRYTIAGVFVAAIYARFF